MKKLTLLISAVALATSATAFAFSAQSGVYVGPFGGWSIPSKVLTNNDAVGYNAKSENWTYGATLGYDHAINPNVLTGIEAGYVNFGYTKYDATPNTNPFKIKSNAVQVLLTSTYLFNNGVSAFVKAGAAHEYSALGANTSNSQGQDTSVNKWVPAAAVGLGYMLVQNLNVAFQYERTFGQDYGPNNSYPTHPLSQNALTLGLTYKFAM